VTRCPACGRRVPSFCPTHGKVEVPDPDSSQVSGSTSPSFPGYRVRRVVARGGFGTVFEAELMDGGDGASVAIKLPRPDRPDAWLCLSHEVKVLTDVGPPHVPAVFGNGELGDGTPYVVMQYLTEPTLAERLVARGEPLPLAEAGALTLAILDALSAVHDKGYIHRDLKPENIFVEEGTGRVTLVDFGLTAVMETRGSARESTPDGGGAGTAEYMSPEQCEGRADIDARADLYAMGAILYELCAGHPPFWGPRSVVRESHLSRRPPRLSAAVAGRSAIPRGVDEVVARCLAKDRRDRYAGVAELRGALAAALVEEGGSPPPARPTMRSPGPLADPASQVSTATVAASARGDRVTVGLLFFATEADVVAVQAQLAPLGGQLAHAAGGRYVAAFGPEAGDNPARRALRAAEEVLRQRLCERVRLDLEAVAVQTRRDGSKRFVSPLFTRAERFPADTGPAGLSLTPAAAAVLPDAAAPVPGAAELVPVRAPAPRVLADVEATAEMAGWPLVGRDAVIDALVEGARRAVGDGVPATATVVGEAGQGKSHLFRVLVKRLGEAGVAEVLALRAREPALGDVDHTLVQLLQRTLDLPATAPPDGGRDLLRERLGGGREGGTGASRRGASSARSGEPVSSTGPRGPASGETPESVPRSSGAELGPAVALALGWVVPEAPLPDGAASAPKPRAPAEAESAMRPELKALSAAPGALRSALTVAAGEALRRRAAKRPLFVVLDDAHYASDVLLAALEYAALAEGGAPLWICALGRPTFEQQRPSWGERAGRRAQHRLGSLDAASAAALCRLLLLPVESVADSAIHHLVERAQAIPLLLVELVRGLRREGIVRRSPKGEAWYLATDELDRLPDLPLIEWLARSELDTLAPTLRGHLRLLALLGEQVTRADVEGLLRLLEQEGGDLEFPLDGRVATQRLLATGVVIEDRDGRIGFRHALVREAIARGTPEALRRRIHHAAARHYQATPAGSAERGDEPHLAQLAHHAGEAGMGAVAGRAYLELAEQARARHAYTDAERLYSHALEQPGGTGPVERAAAYRGRGLMRYRIGRYHDALADFSCARAMALEQGDTAAQIEILLDEATAFDWMDDHTSSAERVEEARALLPEVRSPLLEARLLLGSGRAAHRFSRNEEAAAMLERAALAAEVLGEEGYETLVISLTLLGFIHPGLSRLDEAIQALDRTIALCESHGDRLHLTVAIGNRALVWGCLGDKDRMVADMGRGLSLARELGHSTLELADEYNVGEYLLLMDDADAAEPHIQRALTIDRKVSGDPGRTVVALLEARLRLFQGAEASAEAIVARIHERQADLRARGEPDALMAPSEAVLFTMIELATRDASADAWDALEARSEHLSVGQERIEVVETRALAAQRRGRSDEARRHLQRALDLATHIPNAMSTRLQRRLRELALG
jgi:eukaryotic-like serine/threonine-protein kinase